MQITISKASRQKPRISIVLNVEERQKTDG